MRQSAATAAAASFLDNGHVLESRIRSPFRRVAHPLFGGNAVVCVLWWGQISGVPAFAASLLACFLGSDLLFAHNSCSRRKLAVQRNCGRRREHGFRGHLVSKRRRHHFKRSIYGSFISREGHYYGHQRSGQRYLRDRYAHNRLFDSVQQARRSGDGRKPELLNGGRKYRELAQSERTC